MMFDMKRLVSLIAVALVGFVMAWAGSPKDIDFTEMSYDFGTVKASHPALTHEFVFTNTSDVPLTVLSASASCGCTMAKYTNEPVRPGEKGVIVVMFKPLGQRGYINKSVKVRYKTAGKKVKSVTLRITGNVIPEE